MKMLLPIGMHCQLAMFCIYSLKASIMAIKARSGILGGKPVIGGTRISVDLLLELVSGGLSMDILREYPHLKREDVFMVLHVAKEPDA
jgi:uncharacterized protein (DUF433 family)